MLAPTPPYLTRSGVALCLVLAACHGRPKPVGEVRHGLDAGADLEPPRGKVITLVYSSNVQGEVARCGCAENPLGGLARRAAEVARIRVESDGVLSVDAGDLFLAAEPVAKDARPTARQLERRTRLLAAAYARLGVVLSPGERDLALGAARLRRVASEARLDVVSANLYDLGGRALFDADKLVDVAGVKVGVFGVTALSPEDPAAAAKLRGWGVEAREPAAAARAAVASLRARGAALVVALVHVGGTPDSKRLLAAVPGIDWAVLGHSGMNLELPEEVGGARMLEAMALGRNLGRLDLHVVGGGGAGPFADRAARARVKAILADHRGQAAEYKKKLAATPVPALRAYAERRLAGLEGAIARETAELAALPARPAGSWFENRVVALDTALPDEPEMAGLVAAYEATAR